MTRPAAAFRELREAWTTARTAVERCDDAMLRGVARKPHGRADPVLRLASRATDYSALWLGVAGLLALTRGRGGRRAAVRGWCAIAINSLVLSHPAKAIIERDRPGDDLVADERRPDAVTTTHAFPSGHTGSAVAFAVGASAELPGLALPLGVAAALIAYARLYVGLHHPSDLVAGALFGAVAGGVARRRCPGLVPRRV